MKSNVASLPAALIAIACVAPAFAQPAAAPTPPIPRYQVEIIVFAHRDFDAREEQFPQELAPLRAGQNDSLLEVPLYVQPSPPLITDRDVAVQIEPAPPPADDPLAFRLLAPAELQLNAEYRRLTSVAGYRTVLHAGWVQPGLPEDQAKPFDLTLLGVVNPRGNVRVYLSRLPAREPRHLLPGRHGCSGHDARASRQRAARIYTRDALSASLRNGKRAAASCHYFDHPAFGVLVKVTPVPNRQLELNRPPTRGLTAAFAGAAVRAPERCSASPRVTSTFRVVLSTWRTANQNRPHGDVAARSPARIVQPELAHVVGDLVHEMAQRRPVCGQARPPPELCRRSAHTDRPRDAVYA